MEVILLLLMSPGIKGCVRVKLSSHQGQRVVLLSGFGLDLVIPPRGMERSSKRSYQDLPFYFDPRGTTGSTETRGRRWCGSRWGWGLGPEGLRERGLRSQLLVNPGNRCFRG